MAFVISKASSSFSETENPGDSDLSRNDAVSSHVLLKSAGKMDRDVVLRRIRFYKRLNKVKRTLESLVGSGDGGSEVANAMADEAEKWWLQQHDVFLGN
ncbi:hypothetical protein E5676_scaffold255G005270 [Cucumis melo var. makuwa]|uniref:Uncharacterized protein n=2 Tax=Cucumis melo TaxID=3656 RepID=A0A5D3CNJ6_CUCMM|nr:hypothetical protein E5676_scaffold255G005270 [Cucumis melo var. makuwa]